MLQTAHRQLSKKAKRALRKEGVTVNSGLRLKKIEPLTTNQEIAFESWYNDKDLFLHGSAGTGKTLLAFYFGLRELKLDNTDKVLIIRSAVPSRDLGFLPGSEKEKLKQYELPYYGICNELYDRGDSYEILKQKGSIEFTSTSFLRGLTFDNCVVIVDEMQNLAWHELNTLMSRMGENCRMIFCGDTKQSDLEEYKGKYDLLKMMKVINIMPSFKSVQFVPDDVVRSGKAREYLMACDSLGY